MIGKAAAYVLLLPLLGGCTGTLGPSLRLAGPTAIGDFYAPVQTFDDRRYAGVVRQRFDFSCGSASLATLLQHQYGESVDETAVFRGMWTAGDQAQIKRLGFSLLDMKSFLEARGHRANGYTVTLDQIADAYTPGIALINVKGYKHFVVIKGVSPAEVLIGDPSIGLQTVSRAAFNKTWNGVYFIIEPGSRRGLFNAAGQWASYGRAPIGARFADPLTAQALALTAPFYREF